jgi:hypothetical protein
LRPAVRVQCTHARVTAGRGGQAVAVPSCGHDDACGDGAGRALSACGNGSAAALAWPEGAPTDTRFMRRAGSTRTRTRCRRTSRTATAAASTRRGSALLRSAPAARLTKGPRMRCGNVALGSALMADACSCCGPCARAYGHASRMHADAHARTRAR